MRRSFYSYDSSLPGYSSVLAGSHLTAPRYYKLDPAYFTGKTGEDGRLVKILRPGYFAGSIPGSNKVRVLPRSYANGAVAAGATSITVDDASIFIPGGVLSILPPAVRISITSTGGGWVDGDTVTVTIAGKAVVVTVVTADIGGSLTATNTNVANKVKAAIAADPYLDTKVDSLVVAGSTPLMEILLWSKNWSTAYTVAAADTGTNGTAAVVGGGTSFGTGNTAIGTISAVNTATNVLTISGASVSVPNRMPVGVATSLPYATDGTILGMLSPELPVDLLYRESQNYALYDDLEVYLSLLPYWDGQLKALFPEISLV